MVRASPVEHKVHTHTRVAPKTHRHIKVNNYVRGEGEHDEPTNFLFKKKEAAPTSYNIKITYSDLKTTKFTLMADSYRDALDKSIAKATRTPVSFSMEIK
jgi:hypothetical protein